MKSKKIALLATGLAFTNLLTGCMSNQNPDLSTEAITGNTMEYTAESRKTLIPESCNAFFDGCNQCVRNGTGEDIACTLQYCENYEEPRCIDNDEVSNEELSNTQETILSGDEYL